MNLATENATVWSWVGVAGIAVLLAIAGKALVALNERERAQGRAARERLEAVPTDLRLLAAPLGQRVAVTVAAAGMAVLVGRALGPAAAVVASAGVFIPFYLRLMQQRAEHRRAVIAIVRGRCASMNPAELAALVEGLEACHGHKEMRPLRNLLPKS